jgi:hypothetical protein
MMNGAINAPKKKYIGKYAIDPTPILHAQDLADLLLK